MSARGYYEHSYELTFGPGEIDIDVECTFDEHGRYIPASYWEPAEYPEIELCTIRAAIGPSTTEELNWVDMYDELRDDAQAECEQVDTRNYL
jgi:hypothetical protein